MQRSDKHSDLAAGQKGVNQDNGQAEIVEFQAEMPRVDDENVEFIADDKLEDEIGKEEI